MANDIQVIDISDDSVSDSDDVAEVCISNNLKITNSTPGSSSTLKNDKDTNRTNANKSDIDKKNLKENHGTSILQTLDRAQMEKERIKRRMLKEQKDSDNLVNNNPSLGISSLNIENNILTSDKPVLTQRNNSNLENYSKKRIKHTHNTASISFNNTENLKVKSKFKHNFNPNGSFNRIYLAGREKLNNQVQIEDILDKNNLKIAVFTSFCWDVEWLFSKLNLNTKLYFVVPLANTDGSIPNMFSTMIKQAAPDSKICNPYMGSIVSCMHSKLQILFFDSFVRIVVPTGNLTSYDWGETGVLENVVYFQDFELKQPLEAAKLNMKKKKFRETELDSLFAHELIRFSTALDIDQEIIDLLTHNVIWENTNNIRFIHSIGGRHAHSPDLSKVAPKYKGYISAMQGTVGNVSGSAYKHTGLNGLSLAVQTLQQNISQVKIDYMASSIGSLYYPYLSDLISSILGKISNPTGKDNKGKAGNTLYSQTQIEEMLRIYYVSASTVKNAIGGEDSAGTHFLSKKYWTRQSFPREVFYEEKSFHKRSLTHAKMFTVSDSKGNCLYEYIGSANMSASAWGSRPKSGELHIRNWECGVLVLSEPIILNARLKPVKLTTPYLTM